MVLASILMISSKIVAHLTPRKSRKHKRTPPSPNDGLSDYTSDALSLPSSKSLRHSVDSCSSREGRPSLHGLRQSGSVTPRPTHTPQLAQPTITISQVDAYDLGEYDDLFTKPRQKAKSKPAPLQIPALAEKHRDQTRDSSASTESSTSSAHPPPEFGFSEAGTQSSAASTPTPETPTPTMDSSCSASAQVSSPPEVPADPRKSRDNQLTADEIPFNARSKQIPPSRKEASLKSLQVATDTELYSGAEESDAMSIMSLPLLGSSPVSRRRRKVSVRTTNKAIIPLSYRPLPPAPPSKPPTIPLPATPNVGRPRASTLSNSASNPSQTALKRHNSASSHALLSSSPSSLASTPTEAPRANVDGAHTAKSPDHSSQSSSSSSASSSTLTLTRTQYPQIQPLDIEIDTASPDELRRALRKRNMQLENLANHIQNVSEIHAQEKAQLEKHIADLERDIERRDKEIKGLNWVVRNGAEGGEHVSGTPRSLATPDLERERSDDSSAHSTRIATPSSFVRLPVYRHLHPEDSGAESYVTSGAESARNSSTSGPESGDLLSKPKRAVRKLKLVESFNRNNSLSQPFAPKQPDGSVIPYFSRPRHTSTPSIYSTSSSGSSPFSSPTSVTFSAAAVGLTSIPEARPATANSPSTNSKDQATRDKDRKERERKLSNTSSSSRGSSPPPVPPKQPKSTTPSRLTPSEAYAKNLRKDRPQSIAQVLNAGNKNEPATAPMMEESFGGRSRALLGLVSSKKPAGSSPTRW
ncbi:hypothetical protein AAF712_001820 [Marasmius tenuissimus]|uniref:Uncharacterized protein n=1 Tax=Marasmius tenuissimus TaxID=585030 RepID=A0ABR3AD39_9AGAR